MENIPSQQLLFFKNLEAKFREKKAEKRNYAHEQLVRPDSSQKINQQISDENFAANKLVYEPWIEFGNVNYSGEYVNIQGLNRASIPSIAGFGKGIDTVIIYFFGGSTLYGYNVSDNETIPSFFTQLYQQKYPNARPIKIYNYGIPYYYSYQELLMLTNLLYTGNKPALVIFLDGLNDCLQVVSSVNRTSFVSSAFEQLFIHPNQRPHINDSSGIMYSLPTGMDIRRYSDKILNNFLQNISSVRIISSAYAIKPFFFIQPTPYYHYTNRNNDPICIKNNLLQFDYVYPVLKQKSETEKDIFFLGDMLQNEKGYPFIDNIHYSPAMNKKIADSILAKTYSSIQIISLNK